MSGVKGEWRSLQLPYIINPQCCSSARVLRSYSAKKDDRRSGQVRFQYCRRKVKQANACSAFSEEEYEAVLDAILEWEFNAIAKKLVRSVS